MIHLPREIIADLKRVPELPVSVSRLLAVINDERHGLHDIVTIVRHDAVLTARVLKVANSAAYALPVPVTTIDRAVPVLGESMIIGITLAESVAALHHRKLDGYAAETGSLWRHDLLTAVAARRLARFAHKAVEADLAFTCGLLHDLGKAVLSAHLAGVVTEVLARLEREDETSYLDAEAGLLGTTHAEVGLALARRWRLPAPLDVVMAHHHRPHKAPREWRTLTYIVHLADMAAMMLGMGTGSDTLRYRLAPDYERYVGVNAEDLADLLVNVKEEFDALEKAFLDGADASS